MSPGFRPLPGRSAPRITHRAGKSFASKLEAAVFDLLWLREKAGDIRDLVCQQSVYLTDARIQYIADFGFVMAASGERAWAEAKGFETDVWKIKKRLWAHYGPGPLEIYRSSRRGPKLTETVFPARQLPLGTSQPGSPCT